MATRRSDREPTFDSGDRTTSTLDPEGKPLPSRVTQPASGAPETLEDVDLPARFEAKRVLGRGGMGMVLEVLDRNLGRDVAVKLLASDKRDPVHRVRFRREAKAAAVLRHPNIVTVYDVDTERDFIVMELVRGESLRDRLIRDGKLPAAEVRRIGIALLGALAAAHDANIVHRDVKPANILIDDAGIVKLVDFGIASFGDRDLTSTGMRIGTPSYMAPEQLRGRVADVRADIYAVGATLFEAATGERLHAKQRVTETITAAVLAACGDAELAAAITRATVELPENRFATARGFAEAIGATRTSAASIATTDSSATSATTGARTRRWLSVIAAAIAIAAAAVAITGLRGGGDPAGSVHHAKFDAGSGARVIAVLPFANRTKEPRLDFATSGLSHILATELRRIPDLKALGYHDLVDRLPPSADWRAAARSLGADVIVRGELVAEATGIRVIVDVESNGGSVGPFERVTTVDGVPGATRAIAGDVARAAIGRATPTVGTARALDVESNLQLAIAALERQDFTAADELLQKVELKAPDLAEAQYYRALLNWWLSRDVSPHVTRALASNLDPVQRGFMEGLRLVQNQEHLTPAIDHFRALADRHPDHRDILYGLFEALYHGGYPAEAMVVYRRLCDRYPRFRLGLKHALAYYIGHADEDGMRWVTARLDSETLEARVLWQARAMVARRDDAGAIALLRRHETSEDAAAIRRELVGIYLVDHQLELAMDLAGRWGDADVLHNAAGELALAITRGHPEVAGASDKAASAAAIMSGEDKRDRGWIELAAIELPEAEPRRLRRVWKALEGGAINLMIARVLLAGALGDRAFVESAHASEFPEVVAVADAYRAEWARDHKRANTAWSRAVDHAADGGFVIVELLGVARASRALGDHGAVLAACEQVIHPRRFTWAWGGAVGPCLRWSAEAARDLGRATEARAFWERLLALRANASPGDELARAARAGIAR